MTENIEGEVWKLIEGCEGRYEISNMGRIKMVWGRKGRSAPGRCLTPFILRTGYYAMKLKTPNGIRSATIHRLVALAFLGNPPLEGMDVNHKNLNKLDNRVENLEWMTRKQNIRHAMEHGHFHLNRGEQHSRAKLNYEQVKEIRRLYATGNYMQKQLAEMYHLTRGYMCNLLKGKTWKTP